MERKSKQNQYQLGKYPSPADILDKALAKLEPDGSIMLHDEVNVEEFIWLPDDPITLECLPKDVYNIHLIDVALAIYGAVINVARWPDKSNRSLEYLATNLAGYQHDQEFLRMATKLVKVDETGLLHRPHLPLVSSSTG